MLFFSTRGSHLREGIGHVRRVHPHLVASADPAERRHIPVHRLHETRGEECRSCQRQSTPESIDI